MFEGIKRKIGHFVVKRKYLRKNIEQLAYNSVISNAKDFFFIMPGFDKDFYHTLEILKYYQNQKKVITLFLPEHKYNLIPDKEKYKFISFLPHQVSRFHLPEKNLVARLNTKEFDVVIDLNRFEDIFFSAISNIVKSKIRISFVKELSENYYNLQIVDKQGDSEPSYKSFLNYLQMF
ncbi:MAG: hypothetical protein AABZ54_05700 [Bacteroidota bacterium]